MVIVRLNFILEQTMVGNINANDLVGAVITNPKNDREKVIQRFQMAADAHGDANKSVSKSEADSILETAGDYLKDKTAQMKTLPKGVKLGDGNLSEVELGLLGREISKDARKTIEYVTGKNQETIDSLATQNYELKRGIGFFELFGTKGDKIEENNNKIDSLNKENKVLEGYSKKLGG